MTIAPGQIRDPILDYLEGLNTDASLDEIMSAVRNRIGSVSPSSIRSYLNLNTPSTFERTSRGRYQLKHGNVNVIDQTKVCAACVKVGNSTLINDDCFDWIARTPAASIHAVVTDPPYGLVEYTSKEQEKLRAGKGGIWRIPPSFDGNVRAPLPRFTVLKDQDRHALHIFFKRFAQHISRVAVPGANIVVASNPLLAHIVASAMTEAGLELRGYIARQVMTMRGGDRPKNAHDEFNGVSVMPRSQWEPWVVLRKPIEGRIQDNLRRWGTGGFRRPSPSRPFGDLICSSPTSPTERKIAPHPSLKPQAFMRQIVYAALPLGEGIVLDPFMGAGSTMAAANAVGYKSIGIEKDNLYFEVALNAVPKLEKLKCKASVEADFKASELLL